MLHHLMQHPEPGGSLSHQGPTTGEAQVRCCDRQPGTQPPKPEANNDMLLMCSYASMSQLSRSMASYGRL